jgi:hypothetical protein
MENDIDSSLTTDVSFRIFAPNLLPEDVTKTLQLTPDYIHHQGDFPNNDPKYSPYKHGMWLLRSKVSDGEPLESHLQNLIALLEPKRTYISQLAQSATVDFYCVLYSQNGFQIPPNVLQRIGNLGATFGVILYPDTGQSQQSVTGSDVG